MASLGLWDETLPSIFRRLDFVGVICALLGATSFVTSPKLVFVVFGVPPTVDFLVSGSVTLTINCRRRTLESRQFSFIVVTCRSTAFVGILVVLNQTSGDIFQRQLFVAQCT